MNSSDTRRAVVVVWTVLSALVLAILLLPWVLPSESIFAALPMCEAKARGGECRLCGMTTAFLLLSEGRWAEAQHANRGSVTLYALFWMNTLILAVMLGRRAVGKPAFPVWRAGTSEREEDQCRL